MNRKWAHIPGVKYPELMEADAVDTRVWMPTERAAAMLGIPSLRANRKLAALGIDELKTVTPGGRRLSFWRISDVKAMIND